MKNNFYQIALTVILSFLLLFMFYRVSNLEYKYETLKEANTRLKSNSPLTDVQVKERQFKEEMYIRQQEKDTNLILVVFTIALGLTAFFTITPTIKRFELHIAQIEKENADYRSNIETKHNDFEFRLNYSQANDYIGLYNKSVDEKSKEYSLFYSFLALSSFTDCCLSKSEKNDDEFKSETLNLIKLTLNNLKEVNLYKVSVQLSGIITNSINNIRKLNNVEIDILLSKIQASIQYENIKML